MQQEPLLLWSAVSPNSAAVPRQRQSSVQSELAPPRSALHGYRTVSPHILVLSHKFLPHPRSALWRDLLLWLLLFQSMLASGRPLLPLVRGESDNSPLLLG